MTLTCPRHVTPLRPVKIRGVTVDFCDDCGGVFFDRFELQRFDEDFEIAGDVLAQMMDEHRDIVLDVSARIRCPRHPDVVMMRRPFGPRVRIAIDECPQCGGIWMDAGELSAARSPRRRPVRLPSVAA
jgi:Zn-finger nucleic acid-binding protein